MKFSCGLISALIGVSTVLVQPQVVMALSSIEVGKIAKQITVLITSNSSPGSGVIIKRDGNNYTVLTAAHVVSKQSQYEIVTYDNQRYTVNNSTVKKLANVDLAVVYFTSNKTYNTAKIGNSDQSPEGTISYVAGYPKATAAISNSIYNFVEGKITANASKALKDGYALVYNNDTLPGMSGGAVLNEKGELIGIHGRADASTENLQASEINPNILVKTGFNLGIPINTFLRISSNIGLNLGVSAPAVVSTAANADNLYLQAGDKYNKKDFKGAINDLNEAIRINPKYTEAYNRRGNARSMLGDRQGAIADYSQAIQINPNYDSSYTNRGRVRVDLGDKQGAIADYNQAIKINPNSYIAYNNRGIVRVELREVQEAIADYNQAVRISPRDAIIYNNRGFARFFLGDLQGSIADYNQAIEINPNFADSYYNRGTSLSDLGDYRRAIGDFNQAININPKNFRPYVNRGNARVKLGDLQGAIIDYNQSIKLNPNDALSYYNRAFSRRDLGDRQGGISDLRKAADLFYKQGKNELYQMTINQVRKF